MLQLTLFEKLSILFDLILADPFFIFLFIFTILSILVLLDSRKNDKNKTKEYVFLIYAAIVIASIVKYHSSIWSLFDYLVNNVFVIFYFPNIAVYALTIIIANALMVKNLFGEDDKVKRGINITMYGIIMYLMLLAITTITTESLDVYDQLAIYANKSMLSIIEVSNFIFVIWILLLLINKLLDVLENKGVHIKSKVSKPQVITKYIEREVPVEKVVYKEQELFTEEEYLYLLKILKDRNASEKYN